jgi:signal transduction histidine kinase
MVTWIRSRPTALDAAFAAVLLMVSALLQAYTPTMVGYQHPDGLAYLLVVLHVAPLAWRRRAPRPVLYLTFSALMVSLVAGYMPLLSSFGPLIAIYTVAAHEPRRPAAVAIGLCTMVFLAVLVAGLLLDDGPEDLTLGSLVSNFMVIAVAATLGDSVRSRRERIAALEERAALLERNQEDLAEKAVRSERARIARELHDVVAHGMGVMVIQAGAARRVLPTNPDQAADALTTIEAVGRESMTEMRRLLGVLRADDAGEADREPQPGTADLPDLVARCRKAGLPVELSIEGEPRPLSAGVDLSAYRIVQEALTNVRDHAGTATAMVRLCYGEREVEVQVLDDGRGEILDTDADADAPARAGRGNGIVGMRERVELYGGKLCVGNRVGGGYAVRATLPLEEAPS